MKHGMYIAQTITTKMSSLHDQIGTMVYAHGGEGETPDETLHAIEVKVREYVMHLTRLISETAEYKGSMDDEAVKFCLRWDCAKLKTVAEMSRSYKEVQGGSRVSLETPDKVGSRRRGGGSKSRK